MSTNNFLFSIIIPAYNVEPYIKEAIESVINQDIGFKNVELIIVDDGTPDSSGIIADSYAEKYPNNITVIHKENGGLSSARNAGVKIAKGTYLSFLDGDDTLALNTLSTVYDFLSNDDTDIKIATIPVVYFENREGDHVLNFKFNKGTRIINLLEEFEYPQHFISATFIKTDFAKENAFKEDLIMALSEDAREMLNLLSKDPRYAVVTNTQYNYRWHEGSIMNTANKSKNWFFSHLDDFVEYFIEQYRGQDMPKYVQSSLMYNLQWRVLLKDEEANVLSEEEFIDWKTRCLKAIISFDDDVIMKQCRLNIEHKAYLLNKKYGGYPELIKKKSTIGYSFNNNTINKRVASFKLHINYLKINNNQLEISGWFTHNLFLSEEPVKPFVEVDGKKIYASLKPAILGRTSFKETLNHKIPITFSIKAKNPKKLEFFYDTELGDVPTELILIDSPYLEEKITSSKNVVIINQ